VNADGWNGLEIRHLVALRAIDEHGSFGAAASALGYSQSAISQQIAALERIVGAALFDRPGGRRAVTLTDSGRLLLRHGDALLARVRAAQADFAALAAGGGGPLRVGTYQSVGARLLPELVRELRARHPAVEIQLLEATTDRDAWALLERGEADVSFTMLPVEHELVEAVEVLRDPYVLLVPASSSITEAPPLQEIAGLPLIAFRSCRHEHRIEAQLRAQGFEPNIVLRSDDNGIIQGLVAAEFGVALMPVLTVDAADDRVRAIPMGDRVHPRALGIGWHRDRERSAAAIALVELARELSPAIAERHAREGLAAAA
jgi:DNA-binding transcriptional LysR family regulator